VSWSSTCFGRQASIFRRHYTSSLWCELRALVAFGWLQDTIKWLWKWKRIKLVTLLWYIMIHGQQNLKFSAVTIMQQLFQLIFKPLNSTVLMLQENHIDISIFDMAWLFQLTGTLLYWLICWFIIYFLWLCSPARTMASCGSAAQRGLWSPVALQPSAGYGLLWLCSPAQAMASSFTRFLDHTQRRETVGRTPLNEWSARRRDLYLTTHNTHNRQTSMSPVGFESMIAAGEWP
jgi:hypothetical protein